MFLKQLDQFMLQYYTFKAENIAKQQKCRELWYIFAIRVTSQIAGKFYLLVCIRNFDNFYCDKYTIKC